jgi:hypothetical protein
VPECGFIRFPAKESENLSRPVHAKNPSKSDSYLSGHVRQDDGNRALHLCDDAIRLIEAGGKLMHNVLIPNPSASIHGLSRVDQEAGDALPDVPDEWLAIGETSSV